jgi:hypothetical protein
MTCFNFGWFSKNTPSFQHLDLCLRVPRPGWSGLSWGPVARRATGYHPLRERSATGGMFLGSMLDCKLDLGSRDGF